MSKNVNYNFYMKNILFSTINIKNCFTDQHLFNQMQVCYGTKDQHVQIYKTDTHPSPPAHLDLSGGEKDNLVGLIKYQKWVSKSISFFKWSFKNNLYSLKQKFIHAVFGIETLMKILKCKC